MKRQKKGQNGDNSDRLSNLPDHLLLHIMELMEDPKQSIQTCVLSKRWKDLWKSLTMLILHHLRDKKFVSHILSGRDDSLPLHHLRYYHLISKNKKEKSLHLDLETKLLEVMKYGASHNMKQLLVTVDRGLIKDLELPPSIFHCHSLTTLKLDFRHPSSHDYIKILFPKSLNLPALKTLYLAFLTFTTSETGCAEPFSACKMLINLLIFCCCLQDDAKALCISNSNVSLLVIRDGCKHTRGSYKNVVFCTPKLTFLSFLGYPDFVFPSVCKLPFLEEGNIDHGCSNSPFKESLLIGWLHLLANVKKMNISFRTLCEIHTFLKKYPTNIVPCFVKWRSLEVLCRRSDSQIIDEIIIGKLKEMVTCLLQNSRHAKVEIILLAGSRKPETSVGARIQWMDGAIHFEDNMSKANS